MSNDGATVATGVFGGATICILVCLFFFGIPMFISGIILVVIVPFGAFLSAGIALIVISCLLMVAGIITAILTVVYANKAVRGNGRVQQAPTLVVGGSTVHTSAGGAIIYTSQTSGTMGVIHHQPQPQPQPQPYPQPQTPPSQYGAQYDMDQYGHQAFQPVTAAPAIALHQSSSSAPQPPSYTTVVDTKNVRY